MKKLLLGIALAFTLTAGTVDAQVVVRTTYSAYKVSSVTKSGFNGTRYNECTWKVYRNQWYADGTQSTNYFTTSTTSGSGVLWPLTPPPCPRPYDAS